MRNWSPAIVKRTSVQKSNKNDIFMARVKNSNCLNFCTQVDPSKTIKAVYFFPQMYFNFREKRTFRFHPLESMNRVITGRKLNTFARFAFQRYYVQGNLTNVSSFIDSLYSVKCKYVKDISNLSLFCFISFQNNLATLAGKTKTENADHSSIGQFYQHGLCFFFSVLTMFTQSIKSYSRCWLTFFGVSIVFKFIGI